MYRQATNTLWICGFMNSNQRSYFIHFHHDGDLLNTIDNKIEIIQPNLRINGLAVPYNTYR